MNPNTSSPVYDAATVADLLGISYTAGELAAFGSPPDPLDGWVTFFDPGWSMSSLRVHAESYGHRLFFQSFDDDPWRGPFKKCTDRPCFRQLRMEPMSETIGLNYLMAVRELQTGEHIPAARVVCNALFIHFIASGIRLLPDLCVFCADTVARNDSMVCIGGYQGGGLTLKVCYNDWAYPYTGLAASRNV